MTFEDDTNATPNDPNSGGGGKPQMSTDQMQLDISAARAFLSALDPLATAWTFVALDDDKGRKLPTLSRKIHASIDDAWPMLVTANGHGAGVFITVNETDGKGRKAENIRRVRAVWHDDDTGAGVIDPDTWLPPAGMPEPLLTVKTSERGTHRYWPVDGASNAEHAELMARLVRLGCDKNAKDLPRIMRLAGTYNMKDPAAPYMVRVVENSAAMWGPYPVGDLLRGVPPVPPKPERKKSEPGNVPAGGIEYATPDGVPASVNMPKLRSALDWLASQGHADGHGTWIDIGMSLHGECDGSEGALAIWDAWSQSSGKYIDADTRKRWDSFGRGDGQRKLGSLYRDAANTGWVWRDENDAVHGLAPVPGGWGPPDMSLIRPVQVPPPVFPTEVFGTLAPWLVDMATAKGAPVDYVAAGVLATAAALIGTTRVLEVTPQWREPCILWCAVVGPPSANKSPALDAALGPIAPIEAEMNRAFEFRLSQFEAAKIAAEAAEKTWRAQCEQEIKRGAMPPPMPPEAREPATPKPARVIVRDQTAEALFEILAHNPRGLLIARDELAAMLGSADRYGGGKGSDRANWLELYGARPHTVDRKSKAEPLRIPHMSASILGGIQPDLLREHITQTAADGFAARFMFFWPNPMPHARLRRDAPSDAGLAAVFNRLALLTHDFDAPVPVRLSDDAFEAFEAWRLSHSIAINSASGATAEAMGKHPGLLLRVALVLEHIEGAASGEARTPLEVSAATLVRAAAFVDGYCKPMLRRVHGDGRSQVHREAGALASKIIERRAELRAKGKINAREVRRSWGVVSDKIAKDVFAELVDAGWLRRVPTGTREEAYDVNPAVFATAVRAASIGTIGTIGSGLEA